MRRNTQIPKKPLATLARSRRHRTMVQTQFCLLSNSKQHPSIRANFMHSEFIARNFIDETLIAKVQEEVHRKQMKKIVDKTVDECLNIFQNQNWQISPNGPNTDRYQEIQIRPDQEPQILKFQPILGFEKPKKLRTTKIQTQTQNHTQTSLSYERIKINSTQKSFKPGHSKSASKNTINTHRSIASKINSSMSNEFPKLIPLRIENQPNTPEGSYRRNLQDFLREKKSKDETNVGYKMKYFDQKQNHGLRTIQEFKSSFMGLPTKSQNGQNPSKLPLIAIKQEAGMDYDGSLIPLRKNTTSKRSQILKTVCKVKNLTEETKKPPVSIKKKVATLKIRSRTLKKDTINLGPILFHNAAEDDLKTIIEQSLNSNRVKFRQIDENEQTPIYEIEAQ